MMLTSPTASSWMRTSQVDSLVHRACDPSLHEPNFALHLEVAEHINSKKANNPREAAMLIARLANHRNPHVAILALALLDTLVKSCGYPFHLQISTKEFLNELVRRFPERPPPFPGPVMSRILDLIHGWKQTICAESRWKEDLGNIRDMHRLLTFKGYRFKEFPSRDRQSVVDQASANLKSAEELEEEDREAQSAKLQELIRRGTPRDLVAAQELMKSLAGANPDAKPDYRTQALMELNKLEQKVILLNEMLDNVDTERGEKFTSGDAYDQVSSILTTTRPKLQKWISDAQEEDPESMNTFLQINDQINTVLNRYEAFKKGDYTVAANPIPTEVFNAASTVRPMDSLIDFDDPPHASVSVPSKETDLSGLFAAPASATVTPAAMFANQHQQYNAMHAPHMQAQKTTTTTHAPTPVQLNNATNSNANRMNMLLGLGGASTRATTVSPPAMSLTPPAAIRLGTPVIGAGAGAGTETGANAPPNYFAATAPGGTGGIAGRFHPGDGWSAGGGGTGGMGGPGLGMSSVVQMQQTPQQGKDPFADLAGLF